MTTRLEKKLHQEQVLHRKQDQWLRLWAYISPRIIAGLLPENQSEHWVLHSKYDITRTGRELRNDFGPLAQEIISLLFLRWKTKAITRHGVRAPRWRLNIVAITAFVDWYNDRNNAHLPIPTCREVRDFLVAADFKQLRTITLYDEKGPTKQVRVVTHQEAKELLETQRPLRRAWALQRFAQIDDTERHNATHF